MFIYTCCGLLFTLAYCVRKAFLTQLAVLEDAVAAPAAAPRFTVQGQSGKSGACEFNRSELLRTIILLDKVDDLDVKARLCVD